MRRRTRAGWTPAATVAASRKVPLLYCVFWFFWYCMFCGMCMPFNSRATITGVRHVMKMASTNSK